MPLDEATRRISLLFQRDLERLADRLGEHPALRDDVESDSAGAVATVPPPSGEAEPRLHREVLATYAPQDRILRWAWAWRPPSAASTHGDVVFLEGNVRGVPQLTIGVVEDVDEEEAAALVMLGALFARAESLYQRRVGIDIAFIGRFEGQRPADRADATDGRFSVPPPPVTQEAPASGRGGEGAPASGRGRQGIPPSMPPPRAYRSIPPVREVFEPRGKSRPPTGPAETPTSWSNLGAAGVASTASSSGEAAKKQREPSRAVFLPVVTAALTALARGSEGYLQGLFVLTLDAPGTEALRFMVQLVVVDRAGTLRALEPPADVLEAAGSMVQADRREGNGWWRKLSARIAPKPDGGATVHVDVV